jgi:hypothetical protein
MNTNADTPIIPGYQIRELLYTGSRTRVYRAIQQIDQLPNFDIRISQFQQIIAISQPIYH